MQFFIVNRKSDAHYLPYREYTQSELANYEEYKINRRMQQKKNPIDHSDNWDYSPKRY